VYFNPLDAADIRRAMMALTAESPLRDRLRHLGLERAETVRAQPVIHHLLSAYEQARSNLPAGTRVTRRARQL